MTSPALDLAAELADLRRQIDALTRASQMSRRSVDDGGIQVFDADGTVRGIIGVQDDGTTALVTMNDPTPPTPAAPIIFPVPGALEVTWDGTFVDFDGRPSDFDRIEVHASTEDVYTHSEATRRAVLTAAGSVTVELPPDPYTVIFVGYSTGGSVSAASLGATETPAALADAEAVAAAQAKADQAVAAAATAQAAAEAAEASAGAVTGDVATAQQAADDAATQAANALAAAQNAASTGTSAQQAADLAHSAADAAQQAANSAGTAAATADAKAASAAASAAQAIADAAAAKARADTGVANAASALTAANGKNRIFTQATKPTGSFITGDLWIDTANGRRLSGWDATANSGAGDFVVQQFGNLAIAPGTLVASDVLVQGTVTGALLKADAIDGKTVTGATLRTAASGQRVQIDSTNGLVGYDSTGAVKTRVGTDGTLTAVNATLTNASLTGSLVSGQYGGQSSSVTLDGYISNPGGPITGGLVWKTGDSRDTSASLLDWTGYHIAGDALIYDGRHLKLLGGSLGTMSATPPSVDLFVNNPGLNQGAQSSTVTVTSDFFVVNGSDTVWKNATYQNGWRSYTPTTAYSVARYRKLSNGQVEVQGLVEGGTLGSATTNAIFTLPVGYRPAKQLMFATIGNNAAARVDVYPDGTVRPVVGSTIFQSLFFTFTAEQ